MKFKSAWIPVYMSFLALLVLLTYLFATGFKVTPGSQDDNLPARLFRYLLVFQVPVIIYFSMKYYDKYKNEVIKIVLIQLFAALIPYLFILKLENKF